MRWAPGKRPALQVHSRICKGGCPHVRTSVLDTGMRCLPDSSKSFRYSRISSAGSRGSCIQEPPGGWGNPNRFRRNVKRSCRVRGGNVWQHGVCSPAYQCRVHTKSTRENRTLSMIANLGRAHVRGMREWPLPTCTKYSDSFCAATCFRDAEGLLPTCTIYSILLVLPHV